jgi:ribonuclease-3
MDLGAALGLEFRDPDSVRVSLVHRSYAFENGPMETNERLEFLGDAVLGLVVTDIAYRAYPGLSEGDLAKLRAAAVNMGALAEVADEINLGELLLLGKGEEASGGRAKASILADSLEAVIGAVYLDLGLDAAAGLIERLFGPRIEAWVRGEGVRDYKTNLQELAAAEMSASPEYRVSERGPDHEKEFTAIVYLAGEAFGQGMGRSKKEAEQRAAEVAVGRLTAAHAGPKGV